MKLIKIYLIALPVWLYVFLHPVSLSASAEYIQVPVAINISSTISDGDLSPEEIVRSARNNGFKAVIITDRDYLQWEYGLWPLRQIIKKTVEDRSLATYGLKNYLQRLNGLQKSNPDLIIIPGTETAPFYYWEGRPFNPGFTIHDWHKHLLVFGLEQEEDWRFLPNVSNRSSLILPFTAKDIIWYWPLVLLLAGIVCVTRRKYSYQDMQGHDLGSFSRPWQIFGTLLIISGVLFLWNNYPYRRAKFDQYHGERGALPYQELIDYVQERGALVFWAHPEAANVERKGRILIETEEHTEDLLLTRDYTGYAVFYEGYKKVGVPGGIWDTILQEYCAGKRQRPIWAIAGLAFDRVGDLKTRMAELETVLLVQQPTKEEALQALQRGRAYVLRGNRKFRLEEFSITDSAGANQLSMGEEAEFVGKPLLRIKGSYIEGENQPVKVQLVKGGQIIKTFEVSSPFMINYQDQGNSAGEKTFYRLEIRTADTIVITNPIMIGWRKK